MSVVVIEKVVNLKRAINYNLRDDKTNDSLITTHECYKETAFDEFQDLYELRKKKLGKDTKNKARMIYQSFSIDDNVTAEMAHKIGVEFADNYLKGEHQFIVATHIDSGIIHNHLIFNEVKINSLLMFDTKRKNTIDRLRSVDNDLSKKYGLSINYSKKESKNKRITQKEYVARSKGNSFKSQLENAIDKCIEKSKSYDEFLQYMKLSDYDFKAGKHLAFANPKSGKFMRAKTIGYHYTENSIKYRIKNKDYQIHKPNFNFKTAWIDKSDKKYQENYGLRQWATKQNLNYLQELSRQVINDKKTISDVLNQDLEIDQIHKNAQNKLDEIDNELYQLDKMTFCFDDYKSSFDLVKKYKDADNKQEFKKDNLSEFKKYDKAKRNIYILKEKYKVTNRNELEYLKSEVQQDRDRIYQMLNSSMENTIKKQKNL